MVGLAVPVFPVGPVVPLGIELGVALEVGPGVTLEIGLDVDEVVGDGVPAVGFFVG